MMPKMASVNRLMKSTTITAAPDSPKSSISACSDPGMYMPSWNAFSDGSFRPLFILLSDCFRSFMIVNIGMVGKRGFEPRALQRHCHVDRLFPWFASRNAMRKVFVDLTFKSTMKKQKNQVA